jgi:phosphate transport system substrate-binding protein
MKLAALITAATLSVAGLVPAAAQEVAGAAAVTGAGSTFAYPLMARWARGYQYHVAGGSAVPIAGAGLDDPPAGVLLDYEPSGSLAGIMRVRTGSVDFGASDQPLKSDDLRKLGLVQFPIAMGGAVVAFNVAGIGPGELKLTGALLADIFLGKIRRWSDPAIAALNSGAKLPDAAITVVHRSDGSGTTFNFTDYLGKVSPEWAQKVGSDLIVKWPTGAGARGNEGVAQAVRSTANSIGYVEYAQAVRNKLDLAQIRNRAGQFVAPAPASFQAAAASADWTKTSDFHLMLTDAPGEQAYPIVLSVFALMPKDLAPRRVRATLNFFDWSLDKGAEEAAALGYVPLPPAVVSQVKDYWKRSFKQGS